MQDQIRFLLNSVSYPVYLNFEALSSINNTISTCLFRDHVYNVQSNISSEVFLSFINYLFQVNTDIPTITPENIEQYYLLNQEFQSNKIANLIEAQRANFDEFTVNLSNLRNTRIVDKSRIEQLIAHNLDEYVTEHGEELISSPIESLLRIFYSNDKVLTHHDQTYSLIISEYQRTNNLNILSLLPTLELNKLSPENQLDSIEQKTSRIGMIPEPDLLSMTRKIEEQKQEINRMKENYNKIALIFTRKYLYDTNKYNEENEKELLKLFEDGNDEKVSSIWPTIVERNCFKFQLNLFQKTAILIAISHELNVDEITIPKSIRYHNVEFFVTEIDNKAIAYSDIRRIIFPRDSQVRYIHEYAFYFSRFNTIKLPPLLETFSVSWTYNISDFGSVQLYENSSNFTMINNQILLGKSDKNNDVFDIICYANPGTLQVNIPNNVTKVSEFAFANCHRLMTVNISENSQLKTIDRFAFAQTAIESITIPFHVDLIDEAAFKECERLRTVNFPENSLLMYIGTCAFSQTAIESITIPSHVNSIFDYAFSECVQLRTVNFSENSELKFIGKGAFFFTSIETITIPKHVKKIELFAFSYCQNLTTVDFEPNSELCYFDSNMLLGCSIQNLTIPSNVDRFKPNLFSGLSDSCNICISPDNHNLTLINNRILLGKTDKNSDNFDILLFARRDIEEANIPDFIKIIGPFSFTKCNQLRTVHFTENSQLTIIDINAFDDSSLQSIIIPKSVTQIKANAFSNCKFQNIVFPEDSQLREIDSKSFKHASFRNATIPHRLTNLIHINQ